MGAGDKHLSSFSIGRWIMTAANPPGWPTSPGNLISVSKVWHVNWQDRSLAKSLMGPQAPPPLRRLTTSLPSLWYVYSYLHIPLMALMLLFVVILTFSMHRLVLPWSALLKLNFLLNPVQLVSVQVNCF